MYRVVEIETMARHTIDERIRRRKHLVSPRRHRTQRHTASALRHLTAAPNPAA
jgi:hypothetical protein